MLRRLPRRVGLSLGLCLAFVACGDSGGGVPINTGAPLHDPDYITGVEQTDYTYTVPGLGEERTLTMAMWYPTEDTEGNAARFSVLWRDLAAFEDASVDVPSGLAPLMIYSHGDRADGGSNSLLARQFVQNGWIVVAPDHTGNTATDNLDPRPFEFDILRAYDMRAAIDFVENLPPEHPLAGRVDTSRVVIAGHSYGAKTSWIVGGPTLDTATIEAECAPSCVQAELDAYRMYTFDTRIAGVVALDGTVGADRVADSGFAAMTVPVLMLTSDDRGGTREQFDRSTGVDVNWFEFIGACHLLFTDDTSACANGFPVDEGTRATALLSLAFAQRVILDDTSAEVDALLDGTNSLHPDIVRMYHGP